MSNFHISGVAINDDSIAPATITDCAASCGTAGQVLSSTGTALRWITPSGGGASAATPTAAGIVYGLTEDDSGYGTTAIGYGSLRAVTNGYWNVALGLDSGCALTCGSVNTLLGGQNMVTATSGSLNTVVGNSAGNIATGNRNSFFGVDSGRRATGDCNVFLGYRTACGAGVSGSQNVAIGPLVALPSAAGSCQLAIGFSATANWLTGNSTKAIKPGAGIIDCAGSCGTAGQVLSSNGSNAIQWITLSGGAVSDARDKTNITALPVGLDFVNQMNPVSFQYREDRDSDVPNGPVRYGFLAQEVLSLEGDDPVLVDAEDENKLRITYDHMNAVLVKAIQELSAKVDSLQTELETLKANG
jgi:hypothetical protein